MRPAKVIGSVTLNRMHPSLQGAALKLAIPFSLDELRSGQEPQADALAVYDERGAGEGSLIAVSEGREAAQPFSPEIKPVDAYCAAILDHIELT